MTEANRPASKQIRLVGTCDAKVWGLDSVERMRRVGRRFGVHDVGVYAGETGEGPALFVRADVLLEDRLIKTLLNRGPMALTIDIDGRPQAVAVRADDGYPAAAALLGDGVALDGSPLTVVTPEAPELSYDEVLRKRAVPFVLPLRRTDIRAVEWRMFGASYKGATDFVTKWLWPRPAFHATRLCAKLGLSPNMVTAVSGVMVLLAFWLFWIGEFGAGLAAAWAMTFLDTVDGKLARVTVTSSKWGNVFDHGIDMVHPPFWYWAWWHGLATDAVTLHATAFVIIVGGYVVGRLMEGAFIASFKFEMHIWRPFDYWLRAFTARRNPNLAILTLSLLLDNPDDGFLSVAAWTLVCLGAHGVRLAQALALKANKVDVRSFLSGQAA